MSDREVIVRPARERRQQVVDYLTLLGAPATVAQIGAAVGLSQSSMSRLAERLAADGVLWRAGRTRTAEHGRSAHLWVLPGMERAAGPAQAADDDAGARVMAWVARQALATHNLPHRALAR